jgi:hypothetical protein
MKLPTTYLGEKREKRGNLFKILKEKRKGWMKKAVWMKLWQARKCILFPWMQRYVKKKRRKNKIK